MHEIEVFILIDENGDYAISKERSDLLEAYNNDIGSDLGELASRIVAVSLKVPAPAAVIVAAEVPPEPTTATVSVK